jgi:hypothetical protein
MNAEDPPAREGTEAASHLHGLDDEGLLAALNEMLGQRGTAPGWSVELAKGSYGLRAIDTELAALTSDSELTTTRSGLRADGGPRLLVFDAGALSVEIEIEPGNRAGQWQLIGQLIPAGIARIQMRRGLRQRAAEPDLRAPGSASCRYRMDHDRLACRSADREFTCCSCSENPGH